MRKRAACRLGVLAIVLLCAALSGGCGALGGAMLGGIIGYQSGEACAGALIGGAIGGAGELVGAIGKACSGPPKADKPVCRETVVVQVPNENGSQTPVELTKEHGGYVGPQGEHYAGLPTVEQLRPYYGLRAGTVESRN